MKINEQTLRQMIRHIVLQEMKVTFANDKDAVNKTWQAPFRETVKCVYCDGLADLAFVAHEGLDKENPKEYIADIHNSTGEKGGLWLHDACAVAVYFCRDCLEATADHNQG